MSTKQELQQKAEKLQAELDALKVTIEGMEEESGVWKPEYGEKYSLVEGWVVTYFVWEDDENDHEIFNTCQLYKTKEEAEDELRAKKLIRKAQIHQGGHKFAVDEINYYIYYSFARKTVDWTNGSIVSFRPELGYWKDLESAEEFIRENEDELRWYFTEYDR